MRATGNDGGFGGAVVGDVVGWDCGFIERSAMGDIRNGMCFISILKYIWCGVAGINFNVDLSGVSLRCHKTIYQFILIVSLRLCERLYWHQAA